MSVAGSFVPNKVWLVLPRRCRQGTGGLRPPRCKGVRRTQPQGMEKGWNSATVWGSAGQSSSSFVRVAAGSHASGQAYPAAQAQQAFVVPPVRVGTNREGVFFSQIDWRQSHVLLNAAFSVSVSSPLATCGIQWGQINRPTTRDNRMDASRFEVCAQRWMAIHDGNCTVALPDDCKFGHDAVGNVLRPTLLKSSTGPDDAMSVRLRGGGRNSTARFNPKWHWTLEMSGDKHSGCWMPVGICMGGRARRDGTRHSTPDFELALLIPK